MDGYLIYIIIGAVVVLFLFLLIVGGVVFFMMKKRKAKQAATAPNESTQMVEESQSPSYDLPAAQQENNWAATPEPVPTWTPEQSVQAEKSMNTGDFSPQSKPFEESPFSSAPESSSPFAPPQVRESTQQPTGPMPSVMETTPPQSSHATSPNLRMDTAMNMQMEASGIPPSPAPSVSADIPVLDETGVTMDLSSYKKIIEEQLKPKSPGSIVFTSGALEGQTFEIPADGFFIGRDSHASQVVIPDPRVSKSHLWVGWKNHRVMVVDQESRNGTFLNDISAPKITETEINDGDTIILGEANVARFEFRAIKA